MTQSGMSAGKSTPLGVIILAAGASVRMRQPKMLLPWKGITVIGHIISQWRELGASQIGVVHRANDEPLLAELERLHFPVQNHIENPQSERGMYSSVLCAANWSGWNKEISSWGIVLGDQPHLSSETLSALVEFHFLHKDSICQPFYGDHGRHPIFLPQRAFNELKASRDGTLKDFLKHVHCPSVLYPVKDLGVALDMDTPEDYKRLRELTSANES